MSENDFYVGQIVICVDTSPHPIFGAPDLVLDHRYTVTKVLEPQWQYSVNRTECGLGILGCKSKSYRKAFRASRFRPVPPGFDIVEWANEECLKAEERKKQYAKN